MFLCSRTVKTGMDKEVNNNPPAEPPLPSPRWTINLCGMDLLMKIKNDKENVRLFDGGSVGGSKQSQLNERLAFGFLREEYSRRECSRVSLLQNELELRKMRRAASEKGKTGGIPDFSMRVQNIGDKENYLVYVSVTVICPRHAGWVTGRSFDVHCQDILKKKIVALNDFVAFLIHGQVIQPGSVRAVLVVWTETQQSAEYIGRSFESMPTDLTTSIELKLIICPDGKT